MIDRLNVARLALFGFGALGLAWGIATLGGFWLEFPVVRTANKIIAGEPFTPESLTALQPKMRWIEDDSASCRPSGRRSATIIRLRMAEDALARSDVGNFETMLPSLNRALDHTLSCIPTDAFLWMARYWLTNLTEGYSDRNLPMLLKSYQYGPNEAWVALKRNRLVWGIYEKLPRDLQEMARADLLLLINSNLVADAADTLAGPAWTYRQEFLPRLSSLPDWRKTELSRLMEDRNRELDLPGLDQRKSPPWTISR